MKQTDYNITSRKQTGRTGEEFPAYFLGETEGEAQQNFEQFKGLLRSFAKAYAGWSNEDEGDLFGEAVVGLARAVRDFKPGKTAFKTFVIGKIKVALSNYCWRQKSIVKVPHYVLAANACISRIKTLLESCNLSIMEVEKILAEGEIPATITEDSKRDLLREEFRKLRSMAKNWKIDYLKLISRAEYAPMTADLADDFTLEEVEERNRQMEAAALFVSMMRDSMTEVECTVVDSIMAGKTYKEVAEEHNRTDVWVKQTLNSLKARFAEQYNER